MQTLTLSDVAVREIKAALDVATANWMVGMPPDTKLPFSNDVKIKIEEQEVLCETGKGDNQ